jgi:glycosyltransferase involved in cell wall biosynthesis
MRVGFDARWYNDSGVGTYVAGLLRAMAVAKRDFELLIYEDPQNRVPGLDGLPVVRVPAHASKYSVAEQWELSRRARQDRLDLFHSPFYVVPLVLGCPVVVTVHDLIPFLFPIYSLPKRWMVKMGYRVAARRAQHFIAVSENTAQDIQRLLRVPSDRITAVHSAVLRDCFQREGSMAEADVLASQYGVHRPYVVVASARNWRTKNLESALQCLGLVRAKAGKDFQTVVYGPRDGIAALGGEERWRELSPVCLDYLPGAALGALFRHATAFVMPSLYEGFGLPILEAMSCGCPVVTSNRGSLPEIAGTGAQVFDPFDLTGMAGAIQALLQDPGEEQRWRSKALIRAADFSWDKTANETMSVYDRVCAGSHSGSATAAT